MDSKRNTKQSVNALQTSKSVALYLAAASIAMIVTSQIIMALGFSALIVVMSLTLALFNSLKIVRSAGTRRIRYIYIGTALCIILFVAACIIAVHFWGMSFRSFDAAPTSEAIANSKSYDKYSLIALCTAVAAMVSAVLLSLYGLRQNYLNRSK